MECALMKPEFVFSNFQHVAFASNTEYHLVASGFIRQGIDAKKVANTTYCVFVWISGKNNYLQKCR